MDNLDKCLDKKCKGELKFIKYICNELSCLSTHYYQECSKCNKRVDRYTGNYIKL